MKIWNILKCTQWHTGKDRAEQSRAGHGRAWQGRAGQGSTGQDRADRQSIFNFGTAKMVAVIAKVA